MNKKEIVCYDTDASRLVGKTEKVFFPKDIEEVRQIVKTSGLDIVPRGAGTGLVGGAIPNNSVVVDMSKMNVVSNFNSSKRSVHVEAGVTVKELNEKLNAIGYEFPIVPSNKGISSIGGMIATNASGNRSMKYGLMKDWIDNIEFVNGKGELVKTSKSDLMEVCGMEGITGIITGATLKIIPLIKRTASVFQSNDLNEILSVARKLRAEKEVVMVAFFSKEVSKFLGFPETYHIIIEFDSNRGKITGEEYENISKIKDRAYSVLFSEGYYNSEDPKFFFDEIKDFVLFLEQSNIPYFGDLGTGVIHPFFKDTEENKRKILVDMIKKMKLKLGRYGYGLKRKHFMDSFEARLIQRVKLRQDPSEKFNAKKMIDVDFQLKKLDDSTINKKIEIAEKAVPEKPRRVPRELSREIKSEKTPEEKLNEIIKEAEIVEKNKVEVEERLEDYKETFESELAENKRKQVEEIAKNIPREIIEEKFVRPVRAPIDLKTINSIMTNRKSALFSDEKSPGVKADRSDIQTGKVTVTDNLDRKIPENSGENLANPKKREISQEEKDMINKILGNKYKKEEKK